MKTNLLTTIAFTILLASCSTAYKQGQTPDDVYYSPAKEKTLAKADNNRSDNQYARRNNDDDYQDNMTSSEDQYLRMKIQNRYRWNTIDDYDYWSNPSFAFSNYYGYNSFNPLAFNSWGMNYYYSPFASIQPYGWFNSYYPTYGYYRSYGGSYGHGYGYGYSPVYVVNPTPRYNVHRPMLGGYVNNGTGSYSNNNRLRNSSNGRYIPANNTAGRYYNNNNNSTVHRSYNNNLSNRSNNTNTNTTSSAPARSFTPSSSGSSGGGVTRQPRR